MPTARSARSRPVHSPRRANSSSAGRTSAGRASTPRKRAARSVTSVARRKKVSAVLCVLAGGVLVALGAFVGFLDGYGQQERAQKADAIVVLGARVREDGQAGQGLQMRVLHAVRLYRKGLAPKIIMTGGVGKNPPAEARVAARLAARHGVPPSAIVEEDTSTSTWENAANASRICKKQGWKNVIVVSDPFHLWRAEHNFRRCGIRVAISPVGVAQWQAQPTRRLLWTTREAILSARDFCLRRI